jgi:hypothetical protein
LHGKTLDRAIHVAAQQRGRIANGKHGARVDDVLARGAPMHEAGGLRIALGDFSRQRFHERDRDIAARGTGLSDLLDVEARGIAG